MYVLASGCLRPPVSAAEGVSNSPFAKLKLVSRFFGNTTIHLRNSCLVSSGILQFTYETRASFLREYYKVLLEGYCMAYCDNITLSFDGNPSPDNPRTPTLLRSYAPTSLRRSRKHINYSSACNSLRICISIISGSAGCP